MKNSLCACHTLLDNDDAGRKAYDAAESDGLISIKNNTFINCTGSPNTEFEDCLDAELYKQTILTECGVDLNCSQFRGNAKWSVRVKLAFQNQGKPWTDRVESNVKYLVAKCVEKQPEKALNAHKRNSIDALVASIEELIKS